MPARAAAALLLLLLCGCLHPLVIPPVRLVGPSRGEGGLPEALGVVPLADLRPREEKNGKQPWLVPLLIWNQRTGRYVTGSEHFGGDVSGVVSEAVADALSGTRFGHARVLGAGDDATPAERCTGSDLAYVASGEIHHLYGAVRQRSWVFFLPIPWFPAWLTGNQVGDPVGVVRLSLRIHDCASGGEVLSRRFVSEDVFPRLSASAAAQRAFDRLMRELADLSRSPLPGGEVAGSAASEPSPEPAPAPAPAPKPAPAIEQDDDAGPVLVPL